MQLYFSPTSPYVRKVSVLLRETGQMADVEHLAIQTTALNTDADLKTANPLGKIPALTRPDAPTLYDSRVICRFLDARAEAGLYPEERIWDTLTLEATGDGIMDCAVSMAYEVKLRPEELVFDDWLTSQWAKIERALDALNNRWMSHLYGPLDIGHISVGCALGYLDLRHDARNWRAGRDALAAWEKSFRERPSMAETVPVA
ncbi:putative GST-like protein YibF [Pelagimonas phthalicica]|uniref:Putative GST-like protein YibF n=1 Tax=Pelagimonas phthalicica TaxID=1037362 RepID=A0A238J8E2_9RHOB|nr:glutathione S-transferase [Pelagimonas phthalicica]TDS94533.1 glutathione S-transferase [Pelagimonas phthalicica]SMX26938.1 putative GST-like protein YibF [Pelagimonas phthalicica]